MITAALTPLETEGQNPMNCTHDVGAVSRARCACFDLFVNNAGYHDFTKDCRLLTCSAEDLVVYKCFANRDRDWADIEGVFMRQGKQLNLAQIRDELLPLAAAKNEPQILAKLEQKVSELIS